MDWNLLQTYPAREGNEFSTGTKQYSRSNSGVRLIILGTVLASGLLLAGCKTSGPDSADKARLERKAPDPDTPVDPHDLDLTRPPVHEQTSMGEKVEVRSTATTPTPTPDAPIYRPLDPSGRP
jgi:hypothetical protein